MARMRGILRPWTQQPQGPVELGAFRPWLVWTAANPRVLIGPGWTAGNFSGTQTITSAGQAIAHNGSSQLENFVLAPTVLSAYPVCIGGAFTVTDNTAGIRTAVGIGGAVVSSGLYGGVGHYTSGLISSWLRVRSSYSHAELTGPAAVVGQRYNVVRISRARTDHTLFVNGVRYTGSTDSFDTDGVDAWKNFTIGAAIRDTTAVFHGNQSVHLGFWGLQDPGDEWAERWSRDEWYLFEPRRIWVPVGVGGATDYPVTRAESVTATDAAGVVIGYVKIGAESASASDAQDRAIGYAAAAAENTLTLHYEIAALGSTHEVKEEGQTATDAVSSTRAMTKHVGELATATNAQSIVAALSGTLAETTSAADAVNASASGDYAGTVTESGSAADAQSIVAALTATRAESATAADSASAVRAIAALLAEAASVVDAISASAAGDYAASAAEIASAVDTVWQAAAFVGALAESASALDTVSAGGQLAGAVAEAVAALESLSAVTGNVALGSLAGSLREAAYGRPVASSGPARRPGTMIRR